MEPKKRSDLKEKVAALSERSWNVIQTVSGIVLGAVICFFLYGDENGGSTYSIYALLLALIVPRLLEQACGRSIAKGRAAMLVTLVILIGAHLLMTYAFA
jgi:ABC-type multidrug transport system permease subunit